MCNSFGMDFSSKECWNIISKNKENSFGGRRKSK